MITVLIVHANPDVRRHLAASLAGDAGLELIGSVGTAEAGYACAAEHWPAVVLVSAALPDAADFEAPRQLRCRIPQSAVIVLIRDMTDATFFAAIEAGAAAITPDAGVGSEITDLVRRCADGEYIIAAQLREQPAVAERVLEWVRQSARERLAREAAQSPDMFSVLTSTEREIVRLLTLGMRNREIALALQLGSGDVKVHVASIMRKLGAYRRSQIARRLVRFFGGEPPVSGVPAGLSPRPSSDGHRNALALPEVEVRR